MTRIVASTSRVISSVGTAVVCVEVRERRRVDGAVLADLELGEMEAERLDLPDQVLHLAVRAARRPRRGE